MMKMLFALLGLVFALGLPLGIAVVAFWPAGPSLCAQFDGSSDGPHECGN